MTCPSEPAYRVFIGLGSNMGDRLANLRRALQLLQEAGVRVLRVSALYESEPVGTDEPQPLYLNAVAEVETSQPLTKLLETLEAVERALGRQTKGDRRPRPIDLDILWAEGRRVMTERLVVPHPRLWERAFVLLPLSDLTEELDGYSVRDAVQRLQAMQKVWKVSECWWMP